MFKQRTIDDLWAEEVGPSWWLIRPITDPKGPQAGSLPFKWDLYEVRADVLYKAIYSKERTTYHLGLWEFLSVWLVGQYLFSKNYWRYPLGRAFYHLLNSAKAIYFLGLRVR